MAAENKLLPMTSAQLRNLLAFFVLFAAAITACSQTSSWVGSWAASQQIPEPQNALPTESLQNATLRQIVHLSIGGSAIRVRLSNAFGTTPLHLLSVHVARSLSPETSRVDPATDRALAFDGRPDVLIPPGADYTSDPLDYPVAALSDLAVTMQIEAEPGRQTGHPGSRATSYLAPAVPPSAAEFPKPAPAQASPAQAQASPLTIDHWYFLSGVDVSSSAATASIVALGDSITDGHGATTNGNDRWTDTLAYRLQHTPATTAVAVLNEGIGGNRLLLDGLGPNALARFDRDVLAQNGIRYLIVLEGINDIGTLTRTAPATEAAHEELVRRIIGAYRQLILRAHDHGIKVIGATIMPFMGNGYYHPSDANESDRQAINAWIRASGHFDAVVDFDKVTADPAHPGQLNPGYDCGDHLHPSPAGYRAMANSIPLALFEK